MSNNYYFLGIDGGGTKTTAVVFNEKGEFVCGACGESINYYSVGIESARLAMKNIIDNLNIKSFRCAVIGMSALNERATAQETEKRSLKTDQQKQGKKSEKATGVMRGALLKQIVGKTVTRRKKQAEQQGGLRAFTVGTKIPTYLNNLGNTGGFFFKSHASV